MASLEPPKFEPNIAPVKTSENDGPDFEERVLTCIADALGTPCRGNDSEGFEYESIFHLWAVERGNKDTPNPAWYSNALGYWDVCEPSVEGMLGGFGVLDPEDVKGSTAFLTSIWRERPECGRETCVDCGGGIGRVTKHLLLPLFDRVHLLEQSPPLIAAAPKYLGAESLGRTTLLCVGMQAFVPEPNTYDVIWSQWVIGHLSDGDLAFFLRRCKRALKPGGVVVLKDNTYPSEKIPKTAGGGFKHFCVDREDSSVTRSQAYFEACFKASGLEVLKKERQANFPEELYPVYMYALI